MTHEELDGKVWSAPDMMASEYELGDLLYGIVRMMKPLTVLETGCHTGTSSRRMAEALKANGRGMLHTCDIRAEMVTATSLACEGLPVVVSQCTGLELAGSVQNVDLALIDSGNDTERTDEALALKLSPGAVVVLHDARRHMFDDIAYATKWKTWFFPTPRGAAIYITDLTK